LTILPSKVLKDNIKDREKSFHDDRYIDDKRKVLSDAYTFAQSSKTLFNNLVTNVNSDDYVLEIGCGTNTISERIVDIGANVTIVDISEKAIEIAKQNIQEGIINISCVVMDAENLKFNDQSFNLIYGSGILHHLSIEKAIFEIKRVLKQGGKAVFYEPLGHNLFINIFRLLTPRLRSKDEHPLLVADLKLIENNFPNTRFHFFYLFSLISMPFIRFKLFNRLTNMMGRLDVYLNKVFPFLQKYNWITVIEITK
jgi:ubiquinone/menaquinone biosynthesis C-methylase UbiE